jgi:D-glycero-alpha-D-manno-heptose-7-phosphate kinase
VGLLHALHVYAGRKVTAQQLAEEACHIEIEVLGQPIGKQDQYAAAFGGLNQIRFNLDDSVDVISLDSSASSSLGDNFCLVWTGLTRKASSILEQQSRNTASKMQQLEAMRTQAEQVSGLIQSGDFSAVGELLGNTWELKRTLADGISNPEIDELYGQLMELGCTGGKLLGAGGGGFILVQTPPNIQQKIAANLTNKVIPLNPDLHGSTLILNDRGE